MVTSKVEEIDYLRLAYLIFKIIRAMQEDTHRDSIFWENLSIDIRKEPWEQVVLDQFNIIKPYGDITREAIKKYDTGLKTKVELETKYVDSRFLMECIKRIEDKELKEKLLNCFLYNRHFTMVKEKRPSTWTDPVKEDMSLDEKEIACATYAKYY